MLERVLDEGQQHHRRHDALAEAGRQLVDVDLQALAHAHLMNAEKGAHDFHLALERGRDVAQARQRALEIAEQVSPASRGRRRRRCAAAGGRWRAN